MNGGTLLMSKLSKEEILKMVEEMADSDGVDIEELYGLAKEKLGETSITDANHRTTLHGMLSQKFTKEVFAKVLEKARGDRSVKQFSMKSEVSLSHMSEYLEKLRDTAPSEETLRNIASVARNGVTFEDLKEATKGNMNEARQSTEDTMMAYHAMHGNEPGHSLKSSNKEVTKAQLEDFLADKDNKQDIAKRVEAMTDAEKDFHIDSEMSPMPSSYGRPSYGIPAEGKASKQRKNMHGGVEKMDLFSGSKSKENTADSEEVKTVIEKLKALGIRDGNYAKVKLGLMGYEEYLEGRPDLLRFKRFKSVLKKAIGYKGVYSGIPGVSRIMTIESLFYKAYGNNSVWNIWFDGVNEPKRTGLNCQTSVREYLDNAVRFVLDYVTKEYNKVIQEIGVATRDEILLTGLILGMLDYGYNAKQILFELIRPTEAKRNWKMEPVMEYYKFNTAPDFFNEMCVRIVGSLDGLAMSKHATAIAELSELITAPTESMLNLTYESLMITNIDEVKQLMRKNRIISSVHAIANSMRYGVELEDEFKPKFTKNLESFIGYFVEEHNKECNDIMLAINARDFTTFAEHIDNLLAENRVDKHYTHELINTANEQMPEVKSRHEKFNNTEHNGGDIGQICYNFQWGTPQY